NCENSEREDIDCDVVSRFVFQSLWRHVDGGSWCLGHGGSSQTRHDASHAQVGYLGHHPLVQENVSGRQVAVDDGRRVAVQEREPAGHVVKDGAFQRDGDEGLGRRRRLGIQNVVETGRQLLHDKRRHPRAGQETHAKELDDVRVAEGAHQLTLSRELLPRFLDAFARHLPRVLEKVVDLLGGAHGSWNCHLLHAAVRASPDGPARGSSGGEEERTKVGMVAEERRGQGLGSHCC
ncbi:hypothetical protein GBAR_LOCUS12416, partial [Geodia barretti]